MKPFSSMVFGLARAAMIQSVAEGLLCCAVSVSHGLAVGGFVILDQPIVPCVFARRWWGVDVVTVAHGYSRSMKLDSELLCLTVRECHTRPE